MQPSFNLIGGGRLGCTLARMWYDAGLISVVSVVTRNPAHAEAAAAFIGAGQPRRIDTLPPADITLLATPDDTIGDVAAAIALHASKPGSVAFHCSGALTSEVLAPLRAKGVDIASVHPLKSFADPSCAIRDFSGCFCACEGDAKALEIVWPLFDTIGAKRLDINAQSKMLYHAGAVLACNDLVALMEAALRCMEGAGVTREQAWPALRPLIGGALANIDLGSTATALTGPVARGDTATVQRQLAETNTLDESVGGVYAALGRIALELAQLPPGVRGAMATALEGRP